MFLDDGCILTEIFELRALLFCASNVGLYMGSERIQSSFEPFFRCIQSKNSDVG